MSMKAAIIVPVFLCLNVISLHAEDITMLDVAEAKKRCESAVMQAPIISKAKHKQGSQDQLKKRIEEAMKRRCGMIEENCKTDLLGKQCRMTLERQKRINKASPTPTLLLPGASG